MRPTESSGELGSGWGLTLYPEAGEAGGRYYGRGERSGIRGEVEPDPGRSEVEAARRARGKLRRYGAAHRLNRLGTLTYASPGCQDPLALRSDLARFFRSLRGSLGGDAFPYVWVPEWHKTGHGLHAHFAVGRYVRRELIEEAWGQGFVHIKLIGDLPVGSAALEEARVAARYLAKYAGKAFDVARLKGLHRYEVAQGFQPQAERLFGRRLDDVIDKASERMGRAPSVRWTSADAPRWRSPPAVWLAWGP